MAALAMLCGTRALFGAPSRGWDIAFLALATLPAAFFGGKNLVLRREFGLGELGTFLLLGTAIFRLRGPDVRAILDGSFREGGKVILVNIGVLMCALIVPEGRLAGRPPGHRKRRIKAVELAGRP